MHPAQKANRTADSESRVGELQRLIARDAARSQIRVRMRPVHFACVVALIALGSAPAYGVPLGSVSGLVRDSSGIPQIGAQVQLLRPNLSVAAIVYTDAGGRYAIGSINPGRYALKAMGTWFLPSLRENVHIRAYTVVNLT